ncbi:hypothetical protein HDV03_004357 [Kappamyces sp. JEL0829]|nr:hypothetical protein HDV03_004357 [Kappamyces sp. JEL0829]
MLHAAITGANGELGVGIVSQLFAHFPPESVELKVFLLCRSAAKAEEAVDKLLAKHPAVNAENLVFVQCDLASSESVFSCCETLARHLDGLALDFLFLNAGVMPTEGMDLLLGIKNMITRPGWVAKTGGDIMKQTTGQTTPDGLGYVFACNVFGHYALVKQLTPFLEKSQAGARILWCSSTTAVPEFFDSDDWQCIKGAHPYESSKRLCELVSMAIYPELRRKGIYSFITSPGNILSGISTSQASVWMVLIGFFLMRLFGSSGTNVTGENGATSAMWLVSRPDPESVDPHLVYHSDITRWGSRFVKELDIDHSVADIQLGRQLVGKMDALLEDMLQRRKAEQLCDIGKGDTVLLAPSYASVVDEESTGKVCSYCVAEPTTPAAETLLHCPDCGAGYCSDQCRLLDQPFHSQTCQFDHSDGLGNYAKDYSRLLMKILYKMHREPRHPHGPIIESMWFDLETQSNEQKKEYEAVSLDLDRYLARWIPDFCFPPVCQDFQTALNSALSASHSPRIAYLYSLISKEECNSFGLYTFCYKGSGQPRQGFGLALFPTAIFFNHSCDPNVGRRYTSDGHMEFFALRAIGAGEEASITYMDLNVQREERQAYLRDVFHFQCTCSRCESESQGSYLFDSSLTICGRENCLAPLAPKYGNRWECLGCRESLTSM